MPTASSSTAAADSGASTSEASAAASTRNATDIMCQPKRSTKRASAEASTPSCDIRIGPIRRRSPSSEWTAAISASRIAAANVADAAMGSGGLLAPRNRDDAGARHLDQADLAHQRGEGVD